MAQILTPEVQNSLHFPLESILTNALAGWRKKQQHIDEQSGRHIPVCPAYLAGKCERGQACMLRHSRGDKDQFVCKHWIRGLCIAEGTPVDTPNGTSIPIEQIQEGQQVLSHSESTNGVVPATVSHIVHNGQRHCVELTLSDGRTLVCTNDHKILTKRGWVEAAELKTYQATEASPGDQIVMGVQFPLDKPSFENESTMSIELPEISRSLKMKAERQTVLAFARIVGLTSAIYSYYQEEIERLQAASVIRCSDLLDATTLQHDIDLVTQVPSACDCDVKEPHAHLGKQFITALQRYVEPFALPKLITQPTTPTPFVREFLAAHLGHVVGPISIQRGTDRPAKLAFQSIFGKEGSVTRGNYLFPISLAALLEARFGVQCTRSVAKPSATQVTRPKLAIQDAYVTRFADTIGFRYSSAKSQRLCLVAAYLHEEKFMAAALDDSQLLAHVDLREETPVYNQCIQRHACGPGGMSFNCFERRSNFNDRARLTHSFTQFLRRNNALQVFRSQKSFKSRGNPSRRKESNVYASWTLQVARVQEVGERQVYDVTVPSYENFSANGLIVHNCKRNELCEFLHEYDLSRMPPCHFFTTYGECSNEDCPFLHIEASTQQHECPRYSLRGFCPNGPHCQYMHTRRKYCADYLAGFCSKGAECTEAHPKWLLPSLDDEEMEEEDAAQVATIGNSSVAVPVSHKGFLKPEAAADRNMQQVICNRCREPGHFASQCPQNRGDAANARPLREVTCFKCGAKGHYAHVCPNQRRQGPHQQQQYQQQGQRF